MKSLSLPRPMILMMIGVPGSGKSFFARQFAEMFSAPLVSQDRIRTLIFENSQYSREEDELIQSVGDLQILELIKTQKTFLVDGGLSARADRNALEKLGKGHGYGTLTIWVQTDEPTSKLRALRRSPRRSGDVNNTSLTEEQFETLSKHLTAPGAQEPFVVVSGKHTYATQAKIVLKKLIAPREERVTRSVTPGPSSHGQQPPSTHRRNVIIN